MQTTYRALTQVPSFLLQGSVEPPLQTPPNSRTEPGRDDALRKQRAQESLTMWYTFTEFGDDESNTMQHVREISLVSPNLWMMSLPKIHAPGNEQSVATRFSRAQGGGLRIRHGIVCLKHIHASRR